MSLQTKAIKKYTKEVFSSTLTYLLTAVFLTVWYLFSGDVFHWVWVEPLEVPPLERILYSVITFYTLGRLIYNTGFYLALWKIFYALGDMRSYKELKAIIWLCLTLIMYFWIIPAVIAVLNWIISIGYNIFKFALYAAPSLVISVLIVGVYYYVRSNKKQLDLLSLNKMNNGMIAFMRDQTIPGPVMLDIEITNTFPVISLTEVTKLVYGEGEEILKNYDHISIPSDFRLHITGEKEHIFFDVTPVLDLLQTHSNEPVHYFTIVGLPSSLARELVQPGKTKTWHESMIISPFKDSLYNDSTRLFVDFFLHNSEVAQDTFIKLPFVREGMRLVGDANGAVIGPHSFASMQRKRRDNHDLMFTMRFGYMETESNNVMSVHTPLKVFQRREKNPTHIPKSQ